MEPILNALDVIKAWLLKIGTLLNDRRLLTVLGFVIVPLLVGVGAITRAIPEEDLVKLLTDADAVNGALVTLITVVGALVYTVGKLVESYAVRPPSGLDEHRTPKG